MDVKLIIAENKRRQAENAKEYNPIQGTPYCDEIKRNLFDIKDAFISKQYIPVEMEDEKLIKALRKIKSFAKLAQEFYGNNEEENIVDLWREFLNIRCKYDFEFWCATQIKITYKGEGKKGAFILNKPQRIYLKTLEKLRKDNKPIDIILLKARQWGGSTLTQMYMLWIQLFWRKLWNSVICGDIEQQSRIVNNIMKSALRDYDLFITDGQPIKLNVFNKTTGITELTDRQCTISIGSAQKPDKLRSENISMCHLTEVGLWKKTAGKSPEDLIQSIMGSVLEGAYTMIVLESTAKGVGNYFHNTWLGAWNGKNQFTPVFIAWFLVGAYEKPIEQPLKQFIQSLNEYEQYLFSLGATLEGINWYREKSKTMDDFRLKSEFPSTPDEAFQSTGRPYFKQKYISAQYENCKDPIMVGDIFSSLIGSKECLKDLRFESDIHGNLQIWKNVDTTQSIADRYLVTVDLGKGITDKADNSIICVWDRYWQQSGEDGYPEVVAEWCGHNEIDLIAWKAVSIAKYYNNALLVIEANTIESSKEQRFRACLEVIKDHYDNIYKRPVKNNGEVGNSPTAQFRYGFWTSRQSKETICSELNWALREGMYIERSKEALHEMQVFEYKPDGTIGAVVGNHDDRVITRALGIHFCYHKMPLPTPQDKEKNKIITIQSF